MSHEKRSSSLFPDADTEDHDGELWLVSYADMVTLLFGFFVILFSFLNIDDKKFDQMSEKVAEAFKSNDTENISKSEVGVIGEERQVRALQMLITMLGMGENMDTTVNQIEEVYAQSQMDASAKNIIKEKIISRHREIIASSTENESLHNVELILPELSLFNSGDTRLKANAKAKIRALATDLNLIDGLVEIEVNGHTDSQAVRKNSPYINNFTLSSVRAGAVAEILLQTGISPKKISVRGMGSLFPILPERDLEGNLIYANMAKNRRVTILVKMRKNDENPIQNEN